MRVKFFSNAYSFLKEDISVSLSISYIVLVTIGMLFNAAFYMRFNINIIEYSDLSDFLLAPFKDPAILLFSIASIVLIYLFSLIDNWMEGRFPNLQRKSMLNINKEKFYEWYSIKGTALLLLYYVLIAAFLYGVIKSSNVKNRTYEKTQITCKDNKFNAQDSLIYIGKTSGFVFMYYQAKKQTAIIPISDILRIDVKK